MANSDKIVSRYIIRELKSGIFTLTFDLLYEYVFAYIEGENYVFILEDSRQNIIIQNFLPPEAKFIRAVDQVPYIFEYIFIPCPYMDFKTAISESIININ